MDECDDFLGLGQSFVESFTDSFVNFFNFDFQDLGSFSQSFADVVSKNLFAHDDVLDKLCFQVGEKVVLDFLDDFLDLCDSFDNQFLDEFINFLDVNLDLLSNLVDFGAHIGSKNISTFEVMYHLLDFCTDKLDDIFGFSQSFVKSFTDGFVNLSNLDFQHLGSFSQSFADIVSKNIFAGDGVDFGSREEMFLQFLDDFLKFGDSLGNEHFHVFLNLLHFDRKFGGNFCDFSTDIFGEDGSTVEVCCHLDDFLDLCDSFDNQFLDEFINFLDVNLDLLSNLMDFGAHIGSKNISTFEVMYHLLDFCTDKLDDIFGFSQCFVKSFTDGFVN